MKNIAMESKDHSTVNEGYIMIAADDKYYIHLAANLAISIRRQDQKRGLAIVVDDVNDINPHYKGLFSHIIIKSDQTYIGANLKFNLDYFSPFDRTLYVDSDSLLFRDPEPLWASVYGMTVAPSGYVVSDPDKKMFECHLKGNHYFKTVPDLSAFTGTTKIMAINGYIFYFEKSPMADRFFSLTRELYAGNNLSSISYPYKHDGEWADEPIFSVAASRLGLFSPMPARSLFRFPSVGINNSVTWSFDLDHSEFAVAKIRERSAHALEKIEVISGFFCHFPTPLNYEDYIILTNHLRRQSGIPPLAVKS